MQKLQNGRAGNLGGNALWVCMYTYFQKTNNANHSKKCSNIKMDLTKLEIWDSLIYLDLVSTIEHFTKKKLTATQIQKITHNQNLIKVINLLYEKK